MQKLKTTFATSILCLVTSMGISSTEVFAAHQGQSRLPRLFHNVSTADFPLTTGTTTIVSVPNVHKGSYEVSFDGSAQSTQFDTAGVAICSIAVNSSPQSSGQTTVSEGANVELNVNDIIPFAVTDVVNVPNNGGTVSGVCHSDSDTSDSTILQNAQITLVQGRAN